MAAATLEAPPAADPGIAKLESQLPAEIVSGLNEHIAQLDASDAKPADAPSETPAPAETAVEPTDATPETEATPSTATTGEAKPNAAVPPPASWQPDEVAKQAARNLGLSDEVVRDIRSAEEFMRVLQLAAASRPAPTPAPSPATQATEAAKSKWEKIANDELADPDLREAAKEILQKNAQVEQELQQIKQGTQAQEQALHQQRLREVEQQFDRTLDDLGYDALGKTASLTAEQTALRGKVWQSLFALGQAGQVKEVSPDAVEAAIFLADRQVFKEQLRRQTVSAARSQADQRLTTGRSTAPPRTPPAPEGPDKDPQVAAWLEKAKRGELTRDG